MKFRRILDDYFLFEYRLFRITLEKNEKERRLKNEFYEEEMKVRKALKYPPFYNLAMINIISDKFELCNVESNKIATYLKNNVIY